MGTIGPRRAPSRNLQEPPLSLSRRSGHASLNVASPPNPTDATSRTLTGKGFSRRSFICCNTVQTSVFWFTRVNRQAQFLAQHTTASVLLRSAMIYRWGVSRGGNFDSKAKWLDSQLTALDIIGIALLHRAGIYNTTGQCATSRFLHK